MQPYDTLTERGQLRRLHRLALDVLANYDLPVDDLRLAGRYTNTLYRVQAAGRLYMLRVCRPGWRSETDLRSEAAWLQALDRDTDLGAPLAIPARGGDVLVQAGVDGGPQRTCMLLRWVPGVSLEKRLSASNLFKMGQLFARLHQHAAGFTPPEGFTRRRLDSIFARGEENVLFSPDCQPDFSDDTRAVYERVRERVTGTLARLYAGPAGPRVIHNDLWHGNIKVQRGRLYPLDFEDTAWGYPVQDLAMAVQDLMKDAPPESFEPLLAALRRGYESLDPWPESEPGQLDCLRAGRMLWVANYVARFERPYLREHLEWTAPVLDRFLHTGRLRLAR